jgi:hypothetical protein
MVHPGVRIGAGGDAIDVCRLTVRSRTGRRLGMPGALPEVANLIREPDCKVSPPTLVLR